MLMMSLMVERSALAQTDVLSFHGASAQALPLGQTTSIAGDTSGQMTLMLWFEPSNQNPLQPLNIFKATGQHQDVWTLSQHNDGSIGLSLLGTGAAAPIQLNSLKSNRCPALVANRWYHLALSFDGSAASAHLYVDGIACDSASLAPTTIAYQGQGAILLGDVDVGQFAEVQVWQLSLSREQIRARISTRPSATNGLLSRWPLNEGQGALLHDAVGRFNTVTIGWSAPWVQRYLPLEPGASYTPSCQDDPCGWHTRGVDIINPTGQSVRLKVINWFGFQSQTNLVHGLWQVDFLTQLRKIKALGFNTIRLPFSNSTLLAGAKVNTYIAPLPGNGIFSDGMNALDALDVFIDAAGQLGLFVILDRHNLSNALENPDLWYDEQVTEDKWIADWQMLAQRYRDNPVVIGADLHNEPHGIATWGTGQMLTDWRMAAQRAGNAILSVNPNWLIVVEGIDWSDDFFETLSLRQGGVLVHPIQLHTANKVVYSPHEYGPNDSGYRHRWFTKGMSYIEAKAQWDSTWGYIVDNQLAPVLVGEFGGHYVDTTSTELLNYPNKPGESPLTQGDAAKWFGYIVRYLAEKNVHFGFWGWTPNSTNTGGLLADDWQVIEAKVAALMPLLKVPISLTSQVDQYTVPEQQSSVLPVLENDSSSYDRVSIVSVTQGAKGQVRIENQQVGYTPSAQACGLDSFDYQVSDGLFQRWVGVNVVIALVDDDDRDCVRNEQDAFPNDPLWAFDEDNDQLPDAWELLFFADLNGASGTADSDGDGLSDHQEWLDGTFPNDAYSGGTFEDRDLDGMADNWEVRHFGTITRDGTGDFDFDGFSDVVEYRIGQDPRFNPAALVPVLDLILQTPIH